LIAQASAAVKGYTDLSQGREIKKGFLVDVRRARFMGQCFDGDRLRIKVETLKTIAGFSVINGEVHRHGEIIAAGTVKVWVPDEGGL
jgi:3-hydroxymyristoyl/3-hydroxydecanoyl-(acyl carrier protein) dehydratase